MAASKVKTTASSRAAIGITRVLLRPQHRGLVLSMLVVVAAIGGLLYAWGRWGEPALQSGDYAVTADRIAVTPQPAWIHSNVKLEVLRSLGNAPLELGDRLLVERVAQAFALHPWVAKVVRVEKRFPAQVNVELEYRRPVLVVKLDSHGEKDLLFLDDESVLLPSADFAPSQAKGYLRIMAAGETPAGIYGTAWGSDRMRGAARIAAAFGDRWQSLGLYWIVAARSSGGDILYELRTQDDKVRVVWGPAIGHESAGEPSIAQKIASLERLVHDQGPLTRDNAPGMIDMRELAGSEEKAARQDAGRAWPARR